MNTSAWYDSLTRIASLGQETAKASILGDMAAVREQHQGQFFTPEWVVRLLWHTLGEAITSSDGNRRSLLDPCCGIGRMFWPADPARHELFGIDSDALVVGHLSAAVTNAGFRSQICHGRSETWRLLGMDVALINPPFSLTFDHPDLQPVGSVCHRGRFGAHSAASSQWYAIGQALMAAKVVGAVLPRNQALELLGERGDVVTDLGARVVLVLDLPASAFGAEGAAVSTSVVILAHDGLTDEPQARRSVTQDPATWPAPLTWNRKALDRWSITSFRDQSAPPDEPAVTQPVTGDRSVRLIKCGRRIALVTRCGATQARALNHLLQAVLPPVVRGEGRRPAGYRYRGQALLDLQVHLAQPDAVASVQRLADGLTALGLQATVDPRLVRYLRRAHRVALIERTPFRLVAFTRGEEDPLTWAATQATLRLRLKGPFLVGGARLDAGAVLTLTHQGTGQVKGRTCDPLFAGTVGDKTITLRLSQWYVLGSLEAAGGAGWREVHSGLKAAFPAEYQAVEQRMRRLQLDRHLSWAFQFEDLCELVLAGRGICGWDMGLGKARLAIALCLAHQGHHNLIVVKARLVDEMRSEFRKLGIADADWQIIRSPAQAKDLRRINVISLNRLRQPFGPAACAGRFTIARLLRRRCNTVVVDEAHSLRNHRSDQSRAVLHLCPRHTYDLSGTPIANYPRDILPLMRHARGDGTAAQPYGLYQPFIDPVLRENPRDIHRGVDVFADLFVVTEWVTNEFAEDMSSGAKREIPTIADVPRFRAMVAPHIKRRVHGEPDVVRYVRLPEPTRRVVTVEWDSDHLTHYLTQVWEFAQWYRQQEENRKEGKKVCNLAMILRRLGAVERALNAPQWSTGPSQYGSALTSKQRAFIDAVAAAAHAGHKILAVAHCPAVVERCAQELEADGVRVVRFHGGIPIAERNRAKDEHFRQGNAQVLLATVACVTEGLNLPEADRLFFYDRDWTATAEHQTERRLLRPEQTKAVEIVRFHLEGGLDEYQAQLVDCKAAAARAGLDWGEAAPAADFEHFETILGRFLEAAEGLRPGQWRALRRSA